jgi:hypothetical protein
VRVKDVAKLTGPRGEPRIVEALKAGTVTVSSDSAFGLNARTIGFQDRSAEGSTTSDRARNYAIEARDMFIAVHVATPELVASTERELKLSKDLRSARLDDFLLLISREKCSAGTVCRPAIGVAKQNSYGSAAKTDAVDTAVDFSARLALPVPIADGHGGLFDALLIRWVAPCSEGAVSGCRAEPRLFARYAGTRLVDLATVSPRSW